MGIKDIERLAYTENEKMIFEYMRDNSDKTGFDGSMKDIADVMEIPIREVLRFFNLLFQRNLLLRQSSGRHNFI